MILLTTPSGNVERDYYDDADEEMWLSLGGKTGTVPEKTGKNP
jgi:hypothetical protein